jgi:2-methylisocitrate lyase-like PEP mutase family enzyme
MSTDARYVADPPDGAVLRRLLADRGAHLAPGIFDGLSASLTRLAGFQIGYMSGAAVSVATAGLPDIGLVTQSEMAQQVAVVVRTMRRPVVADADTGFGDASHVYRTVQLYEQAGAAGIQFEDQEFPKRCGHLEDKRLIPAAEFAAKIEAAVAACRKPETVIVARTDARAGMGFDEAVSRLHLYVEAGADVVFLEAPQTVDEIMAVPSLFRVPALFNLVPRGKSPVVHRAQLIEAGYGLVILPGLNFASAAEAMRAALARAAADDLDTRDQASPREQFRYVGLDFWDGIRVRYGVDRMTAEPLDA